MATLGDLRGGGSGGGLYGTPSSELRLVLLGTLGCGKSASADTILGQVAPAAASSSFGSSSRTCQQRRGIAEGRRVSVVEAPRWYWNGQQVEASVRKESQRALQLVEPGPHAFLLLIPVCQFTQVEGLVPLEMEEIFGPEVLKHTLVLLTCGDYLAGQSEEMYLRGEDPGLKEVIERCGGRYHIFNNRQRRDREQVRALLDKVENMVALNGGPYVQTSQRERDAHRQDALSRTPQLGATERRRLVEDKQEVKDTVDYEEQPAALRKPRRSVEATWSPGSASDQGRPGGEGAARPRPQPQHDIGPEPKYRSLVGGSASDQLIAARQESQRFREQSSAMASPTYSSSDYPSSYSSSLLASSSSSSSSRLPSSSSSSASSQLPFSSSSSSQLPSSASASSSQLPSSSSTYSSSSQLPSSSTYSSSSQQPVSSYSSSSQQPVSYYSSSSQQPISSYSSSSQQHFSSSSSSSQLPSSSSSSSSSSALELRLVLLGNSGVGKSAAGNGILGREEFATQPNSLVAVTEKCEKRRALVKGRKVAVIDTPDWFHSECTPDEVRALISSCVALSSPGPHAFLMCVALDRPPGSELQALSVLEAVFGPEAVAAHTVLLFTHADQLRAGGKMGEHRDVEAYIAGERPDLLKLVEKCGDRFHVLERGAAGPDWRSVDELLEKVEQTVQEAGGRCYSCPAFEEAEERVRQRQRELADEKKGRRGERAERGAPRWSQPAMQTLPEGDEDQEDAQETRDEAERTVSTMRLESLPPITASTLSPSLMASVREMMQSTAKWLPKMLSDGSTMMANGVKKAGSKAKDARQVVADSGVWEKMRAGASGVTKPIADSAVWEKIGANKVPVLMSGSSSAVRSRAKMVADSGVWGKVGSGAKSGAKLMSDGSVWVGSGAKSLAQSPVWGQVGSGAKSGARMMADGSVRVGAGLGDGVKRVAQSPVWGKMGSGAKAGVKMVAESSIWEKMATEAKKVPPVVAGGAVLGLLLGVVLGGVLGGALGAAVGSVITEVGRRKFSKDGSSVDDGTRRGGAPSLTNNLREAEQSVLRSGQQLFKAE